MLRLRYGMGAAVVSLAAACSAGSDSSGTGGRGSAGASTSNGSSSGGGSAPKACPDTGAPSSIEHVVIIVQENHTFDSYFGTWCAAATGSNPTCTDGPSCCEAAPAKDPTGASPLVLDDTENAAYDPNHTQACELGEMDDGMMDKYVTGQPCSDPENFAYAGAVVQPYRDLAADNAIADRYFQPIAGQSSSNDMYLAVAKEVFIDNAYEPDFTGSQCSISPPKSFTGATIADLLKAAGKTAAWYSEGYDAMKAAGATGCPTAPAECPLHFPTYPCVFDPGDIPFAYYTQFESSGSTFVRDYTELATDMAAGQMPNVVYVKGIGYHSEHPGYGDTISAGVTFVTSVVSALQESCYANDTLILATWDEGGGFFDHVAPPGTSAVDNQPYGTRIPLLAIGPFAKKGTVSHVQMEHSSIVKFLEWNFLGGKTGQLQARDAVVNNIGSLLDSSKIAVPVPTD